MLSEIEVDGRATVTAIGPCPPIAAGDGQVVIGRFKTHQVSNLVRVTLETGTQFTGTNTHPVWLPDEAAWVTLEDLRPGDRLDTLAGPLAVASVAPREAISDVYNLETHGHHVYRITDDGVLVHNNTECPRPSVSTSLPDRVTGELPAGQIRTSEEVAQARNFFKRNRDFARQWWEEREGLQWPSDATHYEHPRPLADGGDPLFVEPGFDGSSAPHMIPGPDGLTDFQRWGRRGGRPPSN